ncbi:MAG: hypothetical protein ACKN9N_01030, partial [Actinomycetota bacterium]
MKFESFLRRSFSSLLVYCLSLTISPHTFVTIADAAVPTAIPTIQSINPTNPNADNLQIAVTYSISSETGIAGYQFSTNGGAATPTYQDCGLSGGSAANGCTFDVGTKTLTLTKLSTDSPQLKITASYEIRIKPCGFAQAGNGNLSQCGTGSAAADAGAYWGISSGPTSATALSAFPSNTVVQLYNAFGSAMTCDAASKTIAVSTS